MYGIEENILSFSNLCSKKVPSPLFRRPSAVDAIDYAKKLGFKAVNVDGTGNYSQRNFEKHGFDHILEMPYDSYILNGASIGSKTGEHRSCKVYGRKL